MNDIMEMNAPKTMYEQYPSVFDRIKVDGKKYVFRASTLSFSIKQLGAMVGSEDGGAVYHWLRGKNAGINSERRAKIYFDNLNKTPEQPVLELIPMAKPKPEMVTFMVNVPAEYLEKWQVFSDILKTKGCQIAAF